MCDGNGNGKWEGGCTVWAVYREGCSVWEVEGLGEDGERVRRGEV